MLAGIGAEDLETILEFVYRGEVRVEPSKLPSLLQAANCLNIHGLTPPTIVPEVIFSILLFIVKNNSLLKKVFRFFFFF